MNTTDSDRRSRSPVGDWTSNPVGLVVWWVLPITAGIAADQLGASLRTISFVWMAALFWMGLGCVLNAWRCRRRHCFISGPVFLIGAGVLGLLGSGIVSLGSFGLGLTLWTTFGLAFLACGTEAMWGRYVQPADTSLSPGAGG